MTLAIETSCDDTSVAVLERHDHPATSPASPPWPSSSHPALHPGPAATLHFHQKVTADTSPYNGIHPVVALESHQTSLALLVEQAIQHLPHARRPDFISVTRGPGMRSNLSVGLDTAKGLSTAWQVPLLGVHHMQAHALTPRLISALSSSAVSSTSRPRFPFLTMLVSGGHTMLIDSRDLTHHTILATTQDIAIGDCLDKAARAILPPDLVIPPYGRALERFAFPAADADYNYTPPKTRQQELRRNMTAYGWTLAPPLAESRGGRSSRRMVYSFAGLLTSIERFVKFDLDPASESLTKTLRHPAALTIDERREMAREVMRVAFEHLASRLFLHLASLPAHESSSMTTLVVSGGVAANAFLRHVMKSTLDARGFGHIDLCFPPIHLCTDNAAMIAWAGMEMWDAGWTSDLSIKPIRTWSLDPNAADGGILGVDGWQKRHCPVATSVDNSSSSPP